MDTSFPDRFRRRPDVRFRIIDREAVILRQRAGENLVLNDVGSSILAWVDQGLTVQEIEDLLPTEYDVAKSDAARDLHVFLAELTEAGVIEPVPAAVET